MQFYPIHFISVCRFILNFAKEFIYIFSFSTKKESGFQIHPTLNLVPLFLNLSIPQHCLMPTVPTPLYQLVTSPCLDLEQSTSTRTCGCRGQASTRNTAKVLTINTLVKDHSSSLLYRLKRVKNLFFQISPRMLKKLQSPK